MAFYHHYGKRSFDVIVSASLLLVLMPILFVIGLAIIIIDAQLPLLLQRRIGFHGREFRMVKFRTMRNEVLPIHSEAESLASRGILLKIEQDPRITPLGSWLRKYSIDELPQLWNVLRGQMSLVGPRPLLAFMVAPHPAKNAQRSIVRPGITGFWQIRARQESNSLPQMIQHDMDYISAMSFTTDAKILLATVPKMLSGTGAK